MVFTTKDLEGYDDLLTKINGEAPEPETYNALWDAKVIKTIYNKLK